MLESSKRSLAKTLTYRGCQIIATFLVLTALTGDPSRSVQIGLLLEAGKTIFYYFHERIWSKILFGIEHKPSKTIWFTGLSGSGKTTIANEIAAKLTAKGYPVQILDGDKIRNTINRDLGFSVEDRNKNIERIAHIAQLHNEAGVVCLVPVICPYNDLRTLARGIIKDFIGVYVECPIERCEARDPKGLYKKVRNGEIKKFTGISDPFEEPDGFEVTVRTDILSVDECVKKILTSANL